MKPHNWRSFFLVVLFLLALVESGFGVDRSKFRTCDQTSFCRRNRKWTSSGSEAPPSSFIDTNSVVVDNSKFTAEVQTNGDTLGPLELVVQYYSNGIFRFTVDEKASPIRKRFRVPNVLLDSATPSTFTVKTKNSQEIVLKGDSKSSSSYELKINFNPIRLEALENGVSVMVANSRNLFNFEKYRQKAPELPASEATENSDEGVDEQEQAKQIINASVDNDGAWEENFGTHRDSKPFGPSSVALDFSFPTSSYLYGIPEHATNLALKPTRGEGITSDPYRLYNLDVFEYELNEPMALYGAVPLLLGHSEKSTVGLFWLNPSETWIDVSNGVGGEGMDSHWISETGVMDVFFLLGPSPFDIFGQYAFLTGTTSLPPMFSIAYHQCRWNYKSEEDVAQVDSGFDQHDIPYDVLWLDIEHTDGKRYFTWDKTYFPTPERMQQEIAKKQRKMVTIVDPHIKRDPAYHIHSEAQAKGTAYIKNEKGEEYEGWCWPGSSSWIDYLNPENRDWWADKFAYSTYKGSTEILFTWNDMNEPSVFNGPEVTMHKDAKHFGDLEHREVHNVYGYFMHMSTHQGLIKRNPAANERPFVLSRAFFAGTQRIGPIWTGDNTAQWGHLEYSVPMLLSLGLGGITFSGADVGGFFGNPSAELLVRWYQAAAFQPFFRGHAHLDTKRREPWLFDEPYTSYIKHAIRTRYHLLPLWYTLFYQNSLTGAPVMRPLWVEFPKDSQTFTLQEEFMVGSSLLVKPIVKEQTFETQVYLPGDDLWYEYDGNNVHSASQRISVSAPLEKIPVFQRGGTIIPRKDRSRRSSSLMQQDPFTLVVALNKKGEARGELYVDDGHSFDYKNGKFGYREFKMKNGVLENIPLAEKSSVSLGTGEIERIVIRGITKQPSRVVEQISGKEITFQFDTSSQTLTLRKPALSVFRNFKVLLS